MAPNRMRVFGLSLLLMPTGFLAGCISIQDAARRGDLNEVRKQLDRGVNVNSQTWRMRNAALHGAASFGHVEIVKLLLEQGADPNMREESGVPPLAFAAARGHVEIMEMLIAHGADPHNSAVRELASRGGHVEAWEVLLEHGVDINARGLPGRTALGEANVNRRVELAKFLRARGAYD